MHQVSDIDLRLLRVFRAVVQCGGLSAAQARLNVGTSKISMDVKALEERLGYRLCWRGKSGFQLTNEGRLAYDAVERLFAALNVFTSETSHFRSRISGEVRVGLLDATITDEKAPVSEAIRRFNARDHDAHLVLKIETPQDLQAQVLDGRLHIGIASALRRLSQLRYEPSHKERHFFYCGRDHPLFERDDRDIAIDTIRNMRVAARAYWEYWELDQLQIKRPAATIEQMETELLLILSGAYLGFLPEHFARSWVDAGRVRPIRPKELFYDSRFYFITKKKGHLSPAATIFLEDLRSAFAYRIEA